MGGGEDRGGYVLCRGGQVVTSGEARSALVSLLAGVIARRCLRAARPADGAETPPGRLGRESALWQVDRRHQLGRLDGERDRQPLDGLQTDRPPAPLDQRNVRAVEAGRVGEILLRQPLGVAEPPHALAEPEDEGGCRHD